LWNQLLHRLRLAGKLSLLDWLALLDAWWGLLYFFFRLRWGSFERLAQTSIRNGGRVVDQLPVAQHAARLVGWASRLHLLKMTCLPRSLTLRWMLGRRGIASELKIGARKTQIGIHAHAWVEVDGEMVGEAGGMEYEFSPLDSVN
jgi:hypothetical protein